MFVHREVEEVFEENWRLSRLLAGTDRKLTSALRVENEESLDSLWNVILETGDEQDH